MPDYETDFDIDEDGYFANVREVAELLDEAYEPTDLGNKEDPFEELVYVVLSTRTREEFYQAAFRRVKKAVGDWDTLPETDLDVLEDAIGSAGLASKKARALRAAAEQIRERAGSVTLDFLRDMETREADLYLRGLPGVGIKTSRCILMYSLNRTVFPLDTHCRRVCTRLGWFDAPSRAVPLGRIRAIESAIPSELRMSLHIRQIQHGRAACKTSSPACCRCTIRGCCAYFNDKITERET